MFWDKQFRQRGSGVELRWCTRVYVVHLGKIMSCLVFLELGGGGRLEIKIGSRLKNSQVLG